jgi:hypothetical protein
VSERKELLAALVTAADEEERGRTGFQTVFARCRAAGVSYDALARCLLRRGLGRAPTLDERKREAARLRKQAERIGVTNGHANSRAGRVGAVRSTLRCDRKRGHTVPDPRLIKKTTERTIEEYEPAAEAFGEEELYREEPTPPSTDFADEYESDVPDEGE